MSAAILQALNHEVRREVLRLLHQRGEARSAIQLSESISEPGSQISYHLKVLASAGAVALVGERPFKGFSEKFFCSTVADNTLIVSILAETNADDGQIRK